MESDKQLFSKRISSLLKTLKKFNVSYESFDWEDDFSVEITFKNYVTLYIYRDSKTSVITYDVGYIKESGGSYWEPPDYDFISTLVTKHSRCAITEIILLPKQWEIYGILEQMDIDKNMSVPDISLFD
jgi:hypothetical protein